MKHATPEEQARRETIAANLRRMIAEKHPKKNVDQLTRMAGLSVGQLTRFLAAQRTASSASLAKLGKLLGVPPHALLVPALGAAPSVAAPPLVERWARYLRSRGWSEIQIEEYVADALATDQSEEALMHLAADVAARFARREAALLSATHDARADADESGTYPVGHLRELAALAPPEKKRKR